MISRNIGDSQTRRSSPTRRPLTALLILSTLWLVGRLLTPDLRVQARGRSAERPALQGAIRIGEPVPHVQCAPGYTATLYASGLHSPDGLAFAPSGLLYVVEERADRVSRIEPDGRTTPVLDGLNSPEGLAFDGAGNLYVVEDVPRGRLLQRTPGGEVITLAHDLQAPEGVAVGSNRAGGGASTIYVTESNVQFVGSPYDLQTGIRAISGLGEGSESIRVTHVITHTPTARWNAAGSRVAFWSYAGLTRGPGGKLYVTNELSGQEITRRVVLIPDVLTYDATLLTNDGVFAIDPLRGTRTLLASGLLAPEGLTFSEDGDFPLYVAEENVGDQARLSRVEADGGRTTVCGSFRGIEDVIVDANGDLYVSEDKSGFVIRIAVSSAAHSATHTPLSTPAPTGPPSVRSPNVGLFQTLWQQLATLARRIARLLGGSRSPSPRATDARPADDPSFTQDQTPSDGPTPSPGPETNVAVRDTGGQTLRCRSAPGLAAEVIGHLEEGTVTTLLDGPVRRDGYTWWQVKLPGGQPCWAAGDWLYPLDASD